MLRVSLFVALVASLVGLGMSSKAQAWGCYRSPGYFNLAPSPGYFNMANSPGYLGPAQSPGYFNVANSPDYFNPSHSPFDGYSTAYGYSRAPYSADYGGYSRRW